MLAEVVEDRGDEDEEEDEATVSVDAMGFNVFGAGMRRRHPARKSLALVRSAVVLGGSWYLIGNSSNFDIDN